jgi:biopolymer transport protein ExbD
MPRQRTDESVSLFPFLDIMACLIGILVLMITAATLAQIARDEEDTKDAEAIQRAEARVTEYRAIRKELIVEVQERKQLERQINEAETIREQLEELRAEAARLEAVQQKIEELSDPETDKKIEDLKRQLVELRTVLANRKEAMAEAEIQIVPSGTGYDLSPTFVECASSALVLHDGPDPVTIPLSRLTRSEAFQKLLDDVKQRPKGTVVFLVRPDGARAYSAARNIARRNYVTNGKLAVAGHGKLDLSLFEEK